MPKMLKFRDEPDSPVMQDLRVDGDDSDALRTCGSTKKGLRPSVMRRDVFLLACLAATLSTGPLQAACVKPEAPVCATRTVPFATDKDADDCRIAMLSFRDGMDGYASCLGETSSDQAEAARADYEDIRVRFNRRARGAFGTGSR